MTPDEAVKVLKSVVGVTPWAPRIKAAVEVAISALSDHPPAPPEGWQPISTAPEDIDVLLWADGDFIVGGYFGAREQWETPDLQEICDPTHWRPLPAPPAPETP
jgi:hypothetical protein